MLLAISLTATAILCLSFSEASTERFSVVSMERDALDDLLGRVASGAASPEALRRLAFDMRLRYVRFVDVKVAVATGAVAFTIVG